MDRVAYLRNLEKQGEIYALSSLFGAFLSCLSPDETCQVIDLEFNQDFFIRQKIIKKIQEDMFAAFLASHKELVTTLSSLLPTLPRKKAIVCASYLGHLFEGCDLETREPIVRCLIESRYKDLRNRAYGILRRYWDDRWIQAVKAAWNTYHEPSCAVLAIERMPSSFLADQFEELFAVLPSFGLMGRFFSRLAQIKPEHLNRLREEDGITYAYVHVKVGLSLDNAEALRLYEENKNDGRIGLLIWSIGKMRLWDALMHIQEDMSQGVTSPTGTRA